MHKPFRQVLGFLLVVIISFSAYLTIVQLVSGLESDLITDFNVSGLHGSGESGAFSMNDVLLAEVNCTRASMYNMQFFLNSSLVLEKNETVAEPAFNVTVPIVKPAFSAGNAYLMVLNVFSYDDPIPGAYYSDSASYAFEVVNVATRMGLVGGYNGTFGNLYLCANFTDDYDFPIESESVDFGIMLSAKPKITTGWHDLGSSVTNASGIADLSVALGVPYGNYSVRARHLSDGNFGASEGRVTVRVAADSDFPEDGFSGGFEGFACEGSDGGGFSILSAGTLEIIANSTPYAMMPLNAVGRYTVDEATYPPMGCVFKLDNMTGTCLNVSSFRRVSGGPPYVYEALLTWIPDVLGSHKIVGGVWTNIEELYWLMTDGTGGVAYGEANVDVQRCPCNLVLDCPEVVYDAEFVPVTVAFSGPRKYEPLNSSGFSACTLAPQMLYGGEMYTIDEPAFNVPITLYSNGTLWYGGSTDCDGLFSGFIPVYNYPQSHFTLSLNAVVDESYTLYQNVNFVRNVPITRVTIHDTMESGSSLVNFNYTMTNNSTDKGKVYVGENNLIETSVKICDLPAQDVPVGILIGNATGRAYSKDSGQSQVPITGNPTHVQVTALYNTTLTTASAPAADLDRDGLVGIIDYYAVARAYGTSPGDAKWDWRADINFDFVVNVIDQYICSGSYGTDVSYIDVPDFSHVTIVFWGNLSGGGTWSEEKWTDRWGCASVPANATGFEVYLGHHSEQESFDRVGGIVEFFNCSITAECATSNTGVSRFVWTPQTCGSASSFKLEYDPSKKPYFMRLSLPSMFPTLMSRDSNVTDIAAQLSLVRFIDVEKKPTSLGINGMSDFHVETLGAGADAYVCEQHHDTNYGSNQVLTIGSYNDPTYGWYDHEAYFLFNVSSIPESAQIVSAKLCLYLKDSDYCYLSVGVYRVTQPWNEMSITWDNKPACASNYSSSFPTGQFGYNTWIILNLTEDVRMWQNRSVNNYGFALKWVGQRYSAFAYVYSREYQDVHLQPVLIVSYVMSSLKPVISLYNKAFNSPLSNASVVFNVNSVHIGDYATNGSGIVIPNWMPEPNILYNLTATFAGERTYESGSVSSLFDYRFPTNITSTDQQLVSVPVNVSRRYFFTLSSVPIFGAEWASMYYYVNGTLSNDTCYNCSGLMWSEYNGEFYFDWMAPSGGTYSIKAFYPGSVEYASCEFYLAVNATVTPMVVCFSAASNEFEPGDTVTFNATVMYASTNAPVTDYTITVAFWNYSSDGNSSFLLAYTGADGVATCSMRYPDDGKAHAFMAKIAANLTTGVISQGIACNPIQLTVSKSTKLLLQTSRDLSSSKHVISGRLMWKGSGVSSRTVKVSINGTEYSVVTNSSGYFSLSPNLLPENNQATTYMITASFEDDVTQPCNMTAWARTLDGQSYPACTTVQYGFKPSMNYASLTVQPQATEVTAPTNMTNNQNSTDIAPPKPPEDQQKEAQDSGVLRVWHEFSWWYPWYRCHLVVNCTLPQGRLYMDYGWSLLPFGASFECNEVAAYMINDLANQVYSVGKEVLLSLVKGYLTAMVIQHLAAWLLGKTLAGVLLAIGMYAGVCLYETWRLYTDSSNDPFAWLAAFIASAAGGTLGLFKAGLDKIVGCFTAAGRRLMQEIGHIMNSLWARGLDFFDITGIAFSLMDFGFAAWYLIQFVSLVS